jgi:hypothetical protein
MAAQLKKDDNYVSVAGAITDDASETVQPLRVNPATNALLVDSTVSVSVGTIQNIGWVGGVEQGGGSIAVNIVGGSLTVSSGTPVSLDWVGGVYQGGGSVSVNIVKGSLTGITNPINVADGTITNVTTLGTLTTITNPIKVSDGTISNITTITNPVKVSDGTITNVTTVGTVNTLTAITNPVKISDGTITNITTVGTLTTLTGITNPVKISDGTITNVTTIGTVNTLTTITNPVKISDGTITNLTTLTTLTTVTNPVNIGNGTIQATITAGGSVTVSGMTQHDTAITGYPLRIGATAETALSGITAVADGDSTNLYAGADGVLFVRPHANLEDIVYGNTNTVTGAGTISLIAAGGGGVKVYLTDITLTNSWGTALLIEFYTGDAIKWTIPAPGNGGAIQNFTLPLAGVANSAWTIKSSGTPATGSVVVNAIGFKSKL